MEGARPPRARPRPDARSFLPAIPKRWDGEVNDGETFASLVAASIEAPVLNLGVASYGTVREIMRVRMQPRFQDANCIVIQYSWNDFDENSVFLARGALPSPTRKRFQQLLSDYGKREVSFQDVLKRTFDLMWNNPAAFFLNILGWHDFPLEDDDPTNMNGAPREETEDTKAFLSVLASFSELHGKKNLCDGSWPLCLRAKP